VWVHAAARPRRGGEATTPRSTVGHDRTHTVQHDEQLTVFNDRATSVRRNDSLEVEGYRSVAVHGGGGLSVQVDAKYRLNADAGVLITCGASSIEMLPDRVTVSSKTVNVVGSSW
jgi:type VI secretion system secreted protein VgrG